MAEVQKHCSSLALSNETKSGEEEVKIGDIQVHNPVLTEIARINGDINKMSIRELQGRLKVNNLDTRGKKDVLKKRLKTFYKKKHLKTANMKDPNGIDHHYKYFIIIDFEATCDVGQPSSYRQEIIEFPAVLLDTAKKKVVDEFHKYVRPIVNPKLTTFCMSLTGIRQEMVNQAPFFPEVLQQFEEWLKRHNLSSSSNDFTVVSDGPWDMGRFLMEQCKISNIPLPEWGKKWINIRKTYSNFYDTKRVCLKDMLERLGMRFQGQPHSGIDDSRNIARVLIMLLKDGANLRINERLKERSDTHALCVANVTKKEFEDSHSKSASTEVQEIIYTESKHDINSTDYQHHNTESQFDSRNTHYNSHCVKSRHLINTEAQYNLSNTNNIEPENQSHKPHISYSNNQRMREDSQAIEPHISYTSPRVREDCQPENRSHKPHISYTSPRVREDCQPENRPHKPHISYTSPRMREDSQAIDSFCEYFKCLQPARPNINDSEFPLLGTPNTKLSALRTN